MKTLKKSQVLLSLMSLNVLMALCSSPAAHAWGSKGCDEKCVDEMRTSLQSLQARVSATEEAVQLAKADKGLPIGTIVPFAGGGIPTGFVFADGRLVDPGIDPSAIKLQKLCGVIGDAYRLPVDRPGTCRLPDLRGRTAVGSGQGEGLTERKLGELLGEEKHEMTVEELVSHTHEVNDPGHKHTFHHGASGGLDEGIWQMVGTGARTDAVIDRAFTGITIAPTGGSKPFNVMQPSVVVGFIIKF